MKILKHGKVERRKFVCPSCGCEYVAALIELVFDAEIEDEVVPCPQIGCDSYQVWEYGEPYEEPAPTQTEKERLMRLLLKMPALLGYEDDAAYLIAHGVTFKEDA